MADNYVGIKIRADDTAKPDLTELKARLEELKGKVAEARADVNTKDGSAKLSALEAQLEAVSKKVASPRIDMAGAARAVAQVEAVDVALDELDGNAGRKGRKAGEKFGAGFAEGAAGLLGTSLLAAIPAAIPVAGVAAAISASLAPALAAGGIGLGLFAKVAQSSFAGLKKNIAGMTTAQQEFNTAVTRSQLAKATQDQAKALKGLSADQQQLVFDTADAKNAWHDFVAQSADGVDSTLLPVLGLIPKALQDARKFMGPVENALKGLGQQFARAFSSRGAQDLIGKLAELSGKSITAFGKAIGNVAKGIGGLFRDVLPHGSDMLGIIVKISGEFARWGTSKATAGGVTKLFDYFRKEGPVVAGVLKQVAEEIPKIVKALSLMGGLSLSGISVILQVIGKLSPNQLAAIAGGILLIRTATQLWAIAQAAFNIIMEANPVIAILSAIVIAILLVVKYHKQIAEIAERVWKNIANWATDAFHAVTGAISVAIDWVKSHWPLLLAILTGPIGLAVLAIVHYWHDIVAPFAAAIDWIKAHWKVILAWLVAPIGMAVFEIKAHTHQIAQSFDEARHAIAAILAGLRHDIAAAVGVVRHDIAAFADWVPRAIATGFDRTRHATAAAMDAIRHAIASAWDWLRHATASVIDAVARFFMALPGRILHVLSALPGQMLRVGENIIKGLIHGIVNAAEAIPGIMKGLANDVVSYFSNPLKLFSPSRVFIEKGDGIVQGAVIGVQRAAPRLRQAMTGVAGTVAATSLGRPGHGAAAAAGGAQRIELVLAGGDEPILRAFRQAIRVRGGNVQLVLGAN